MKSFSFKMPVVFAAFLLSIVACPLDASAAGRPGKVIASSYETAAPSADVLPFTLIILGTRHYGDVSILTQNLKRSQAVRDFVPLVSSQRHLEFRGGYAGDYDDLAADIRSLAADRFGVSSKKDRQRGMLITLKKLAPPAPGEQFGPAKMKKIEQVF